MIFSVTSVLYLTVRVILYRNGISRYCYSHDASAILLLALLYYHYLHIAYGCKPILYSDVLSFLA